MSTGTTAPRSPRNILLGARLNTPVLVDDHISEGPRIPSA